MAHPRREFLQLAQKYDPNRHNIAGWYLSPKLDGKRAFWDGGISRGIPTELVPYANLNNVRTGQQKTKIKPVATGLWSRQGNPIIAPDWFLDLLPCMFLDGELWAGNGKFQLVSSIASGDEPDLRWNQLKYMVYGSPPPDSIFRDGLIKNNNNEFTIDKTKIGQFLVDNAVEDRILNLLTPSKETRFIEELLALTQYLPERKGCIELLPQYRLDKNRHAAHAEAELRLSQILDEGGEGVVLRSPTAPWTPKRVKTMLKWKPFEDHEATIVGFVTGRSGKQGNVLGKIGTLVCITDGPKGRVRFEIGTGLTMEEREFASPITTTWAMSHPEFPLPDTRTPDLPLQGKYFEIGDIVTFKYREWTDDGIPKEARYWRKQDAE